MLEAATAAYRYPVLAGNKLRGSSVCGVRLEAGSSDDGGCIVRHGESCAQRLIGRLL